MKRIQVNQYVKNLVLAAMFMALGLVLPFFTGQIPQIGNMMLPMHLPVLLCGLICGWQYGGVVGFVLPLYREEGKTVLVVAVGCTGGRHRSVAVTHALAGYVTSLGYQVTENHRDMMRT